MCLFLDAKLLVKMLSERYYKYNINKKGILEKNNVLCF